MPNFIPYGQATRFTATGASVLTSANAAIIGIMFNGTGTGSIQLWAGVTATATTNGAPLSAKIVAFPTVAGATVNSASYIAFPAIASGGITVNIPGTADPNVTLFWVPVGGP